MEEKSKTAQREEEILKFWKENKIFEKSLGNPAEDGPKGRFVFYEGPPTANGKPGIHHVEARAFKDLIPRYKTMQGYKVARKAGWDTHGLPVELQVEKQLGLKSKKEIEKYGVAEFNKKCKESVWEYLDLWQKFTDRIGYWIDQEHPYVTYHNEYIESVWNVLKTVDEKGFLYKDFKVVPWCPRCGTALSSHELGQPEAYQMDKDLSVTVKFKLKSEGNTYLLAWTTTPWTLPGNVALAVGEKITYVKVKVDEEVLILAKERIESVLKESFEVLEEIKGEELVGLEYEPLYDFLPKDTAGYDKAYKVYAADFVNTEEGTGVVHTAVMYGQDDFELGTKVGLPKFHLVKDDGHFAEGLGFLSGRYVKEVNEQGKPTLAVDIVDDLKRRNLFQSQENITHSYPHCWRCKTALIYYARDSWYIRMSGLRDKLVDENEKINWEPEFIKEGRFGDWLREVKDWAISRERYWGTPLPIWQNSKGEKIVIGSIDELKKHASKSGNQYFAMRHGESEKNARNILNHDPNIIYHLTDKGREMVRQSAESLKNKKIDLIIRSPFLRCEETAEIVRETLGLPKEAISIDDRLFELKKGPDFEGKTLDEYHRFFADTAERFVKAPEGGETLTELNKRAGDFIYEVDQKYKGKNILIVSHMATIVALSMSAKGLSLEDDKRLKEESILNIDLAEISPIEFTPLPHNENYELDLHKPYIDEVELFDERGEKLERTKEVLDVWFDSGSMPFAQYHYPFDFGEGRKFENKKLFYPADFISEAIDQTRGWFYTLHAIGTLLDKGAAYKNVICLGHILDKEGKKMSKSIGNVVDPWVMADKYGVDALRFWMYSVNQPGDSKNFDEKTVDEIVKKIFNPLENILSFYKMYSKEVESPKSKVESGDILDQWITSRLNELLQEGTKYLDNYKIFEASRLIKEFVNDFSTWYIRRSRDRFKSENKEDKEAALNTTRFVLLELAKYMAPFTPFFAEYVYGELKSDSNPESVHLTNWPLVGEVNKEVLENMEEVRRVVTLALEKRNTAGIKVRQPLWKLTVNSKELREEYLELIKDEINVKEVVFGETFELDTEITEELRQEGLVRDFIRAVQELRKEKNLTPDQKIVLEVETSAEGQSFLTSNKEVISKPTNISDFKFSPNSGSELQIGNLKLKIQIS